MSSLIKQVNLALSDSPEPPRRKERLNKDVELPAPQSEPQPAADGITTVNQLIDSYTTHPESQYHTIRFATKDNYDSAIKRLREDCGPMLLENLKSQDFDHLWNRWTDDGLKSAIGRTYMGGFRRLVIFGTNTLAHRECERLAVVLHNMRFKAGKPTEIVPKQPLLAEHVDLICKFAYELEMPSIALAQCFQWDCGLSQKETIGEWVPTSDPGVSDITHGGLKWVRGLRWNNISADAFLHHTTSRDNKDIDIDLRFRPRVLRELEVQHPKGIPTTGPMLVCESTGRPWTAVGFRRAWRKIATAAGLPKTLTNRDTNLADDDDEREVSRRTSGDR